MWALTRGRTAPADHERMGAVRASKACAPGAPNFAEQSGLDPAKRPLSSFKLASAVAAAVYSLAGPLVVGLARLRLSLTIDE